jgi:urease accessory protein
MSLPASRSASAAGHPANGAHAGAVVRYAIEIAVVTNDIYRRGRTVPRSQQALSADRILGVETGGCPHGDSRRCDQPRSRRRLATRFGNLDIVFVESRRQSRRDVSRAVDVTLRDRRCGGRQIPQGGPASRSDLLIISKIDLAPMVGASK